MITAVTEIAYITTKQDMSRWARAHADEPGIHWSVFPGPNGTMIIVEHAEDRCSGEPGHVSPDIVSSETVSPDIVSSETVSGEPLSASSVVPASSVLAATSVLAASSAVPAGSPAASAGSVPATA